MMDLQSSLPEMVFPSKELPGALGQAGWSSQLLTLQLCTALDPRRATQKSSTAEDLPRFYDNILEE